LITFDDEDDLTKSLPATIMMPLVSSPSVNIVVQFLKEYFNVYDSDSREPLANAYHQNAVLSLTSEYPPYSSTHGTGK
jgi:nuclear RNA export factor